MPDSRIDPIVLALEVPVPAAIAWRHLTDPDLVAAWFTEASPLGEVGRPYRLDFGDGSVVEGEVVRHEPGTAFAHRWIWQDAESGEATLVTWTVAELPGGGSRIELLHDGWSEAGLDDAIRDDHEAYWSGYLDDLRDILEDAAGS